MKEHQSSREQGFSESSQRRRKLVGLAGVLALLLLVNGFIGLFSLHYANSRHQEDIALLQEFTRGLETARAAQVHFKKQVQEWKNILLRGRRLEDYERYRQAFEQEEANVQRELQELEAAAQKLKLELPLVSQVRQSHIELGRRYRQALGHYQPENPWIVDSQVRGIDRAPTDEIDAIVDQLHRDVNQAVEQRAKDAQSLYESLRLVSLVATGLGVVIVFIFLGVSFASLRKS